MALLNLIARLGLDNSGFQTGMNQSDAMANKFGRKFSQSITGTIGRFFTLGFAVNAVTDKIRRLTDEGASFEIPTGTLSQDILDQESAIRSGNLRLENKKELKKLEKELGELTDANNLKAMSDEERRTELLKRQKKLHEEISEAFLKGEFNSAATLKKRIEAAQLTGKIQGISIEEKDKTARDEFRRVSVNTKPADPLARIGGFTGGADNRIITYQERIVKATEATAENTGRNTVGF